MDQLNTFLFEVIFRENAGFTGETGRSSICNRSVIVEVEPQNSGREAVFSPSDAARNYAKELARQVAMQVVQKDFPHGFEPDYSVTEIEKLPDHLHHRSPKFHGIGFRAWLL